MLNGLSIFLPTYNEEGSIEKCVKSALLNAKKIAKKCEVIVVLARDSSDNTEKIVKNLMKKDNRIRLVYQEVKNKGYGFALRLGIKNSKYDYIFYTDADNQYNISEISKLLPYLKKYDIVSGYRMKRRDSIIRKIQTFVYNVMLRILFGTGVRDIDSAFKIYKRKIFEKIKLKYNTGIVDAEIIIKAKRNGFKVIETGINYYNRQAGKAMYEIWAGGMIRPTVIWELIMDIVRLWKELHNQ